MIYIYIAAIAVMLVLIVFTTLAILTISKTTCQNIKKKTLELASLYDYLLEEHSQELRTTKRLIEQLGINPAPEAQVEQKEEAVAVAAEAKTAATMNTVENISRASYISPQVAKVYQEIRSEFSVELDDVLGEIPQEETQVKPSVATALLEKISYENFYDMSFLSEAEQKMCIQEVLDNAELELFVTYLGNNESFSSIEFYTYLREIAEQENKGIKVYVSPNVKLDKNYKGLDIQVSEDICEGIQVEKNHMLYDYAIQKKEIGWRCQQ